MQYYFTGETTQENRNWVSQAYYYFNGRTKRDKVPTAATVNAELNPFVGGYLENLTATTAPIVIFLTSKHIMSMVNYLREERANHDNVSVHISVEDNPYLPVL